MKAAILHKPHTRVSVEDCGYRISPLREKCFSILWGQGFVTAIIITWMGMSGLAHSPWLWEHEGAGVVREVGPGVTSVSSWR